MFDIFLRNGRIIDGTGQTWFRGGVGITGDSVTIVRSGESDVEAGRIIDVGGSVICPGFIDMHSHSDLVLLSTHSTRSSSVRALHRAYGNGRAVLCSLFSRETGAVALLPAAVNGMPPEGVRWGSVREYLDLFDNRVACNVAFMAPHAAIRVEAMGWEDRLPTEPELAQMRDLARQAMQEGAFGFATGLTYPPGAYSDTNELVAVAQATADLGGIYMTHARYSLGDRLLDPFREAIEIGRRAGVPVHISPLPQPSRRHGRANGRPG